MAIITFEAWTDEAGTPISTDVGSIRFHNTLDAAANGPTANPLIRPVTGVANGVNWSFNKFIDVRVADNGDWDTISSPSLSATNVGASGELRSAGGATPLNDTYLYYAFHQRTGDPVGGDFDEETAGAGGASHPTSITGGAWAAWPSTTPFAYGNVSTLTATDSGNQYFSVASSVVPSEFLALALKLDATDQTGGQLLGFTITLTYNEV